MIPFLVLEYMALSAPHDTFLSPVVTNSCTMAQVMSTASTMRESLRQLRAAKESRRKAATTKAVTFVTGVGLVAGGAGLTATGFGELPLSLGEPSHGVSQGDIQSVPLTCLPCGCCACPHSREIFAAALDHIRRHQLAEDGGPFHLACLWFC